MPGLLPFAILLFLVSALASFRLWKGPLDTGVLWVAGVVLAGLWGYYAIFSPAAVSGANKRIERFCKEARCEISDLPLVYSGSVHHVLRFYLLRDAPPATDEEIEAWLESGKPFCLLVSTETDGESPPEEWLEELEPLLDASLRTDFRVQRYRLFRSLPPEVRNPGRG